VPSRRDLPAAWLQVTDSLEALRFGGAIFLQQPSAGALRIVVRDPSRCGERDVVPAQYARAIAGHAVSRYRPPPLTRHEPVGVVDVHLSRSHRLGPLAWTTSLGRFHFEGDSLADAARAPARCEEAEPPVHLRDVFPAGEPRRPSPD